MRALVVLFALAALAIGAPLGGGPPRGLPTISPNPTTPPPPVHIVFVEPPPTAAPLRQTQPPRVIFVQAPQQNPIDVGNLGSETTAEGAGSIRTTGNARSTVSGGTQAKQALPNQETNAVVRLDLDSQEDGAVVAAGQSGGRSDVATVDTGEAASSQTTGQSNVKSTGQALGSVDANGAATTTGEATSTNSDSGTSSASKGDGEATGISEGIGSGTFRITENGEQSNSGGSTTSSSESAGSAGSNSASRGGGTSTGGQDTATEGKAQTKTVAYGDAAAASREQGTSSAQTISDEENEIVSAKSGAKGQIVSTGPGGESYGQGTGQGISKREGSQTSSSQSSNDLAAAGEGEACADIKAIGGGGVSLDDIGAIVTKSLAGADGKQCSKQNANSRTNSVGEGSVVSPFGGTTSDATFGGTTAGDGTIEGSVHSEGSNRLDLPRPRTLPGLGVSSGSDILSRLGNGGAAASDPKNPKG